MLAVTEGVDVGEGDTVGVTEGELVPEGVNEGVALGVLELLNV